MLHIQRLETWMGLHFLTYLHVVNMILKDWYELLTVIKVEIVGTIYCKIMRFRPPHVCLIFSLKNWGVSLQLENFILEVYSQVLDNFDPQRKI